MDAQLARLLGVLEGKGTLARTLVLATADHGESLGEHGEGTHGLFVYDATLRVPWIMAGPGVSAGRVPTTVARGIDVLPTLADYSGLPVPAEVEGRSLRPAAEGREMSDAPAYAESLYPEREFGWAPLHAWRTSSFKLIEAPRPELYDLQADAAERVNRVAEQPARAEELRRKLQAALSRPAPVAAALGYLGGGRAQPSTGATRRDPKDGARLLPRLNRGMSFARTDPELAIRDLTAVLVEDPGLLMARRTRAVAYAAAGRHDLAVAELRRLEKEGQLGAEDAVVLGDNLRFAGRLAEAVAVLQRAAADNPRFPQPWLSLAEIHIKEHRNAEAAAACEHVLSLVPDHIEALRGLGDLALLEGRLEDAARRYARRGHDQDGRAPDAGGPARPGDRALPEGGGARARKRRSPAVPRRSAGRERPLRGSAALLREGDRRGPAVEHGPHRPGPGPARPRRPDRSGLGLSRVAARRPQAAGRGAHPGRDLALAELGTEDGALELRPPGWKAAASIHARERPLLAEAQARQHGQPLALLRRGVLVSGEEARRPSSQTPSPVAWLNIT